MGGEPLLGINLVLRLFLFLYDSFLLTLKLLQLSFECGDFAILA